METNPPPTPPDIAEEILPLKTVSTKMLGLIVVGTLVVTILLLIGLNALFNRSTPLQSPLEEQAVTPAPSTAPEITFVDPKFLPTPSPTMAPKSTTTPTPSATTTPTPSAIVTASPSAKPTTTMTLTAIPGQTGWVDNNATTSATIEIRVGRTTSSTVRGLVGFDLSGLSKSAQVVKAILRLSQTSIIGNPYGIGSSIGVDHVDFGGSITGDDYSSTALNSNIGTISSSGTTEWKELDVTTRVADDLSKHTSSQFRLKFATETVGGDDVALFSNAPQLVITYR